MAQLFDETKTCVVETSGFPSNRSLHYNAISHNASHAKYVQTDTFGDAKISIIFPPGTITMRLVRSNDVTNVA